MSLASRPVLIAGPTASGKSALALALAEATGGTVINADSQQVYAGWRVLSARPSTEDEVRVPHRLYGHVSMARRYSAGDWLRDLERVLEECVREGRRPVIVGGTGLYFRALTQGLAPVPEVPHAVRLAVEARLAAEGLAALAAELTVRDPGTATALDLANPARVARALEVLDATGRGLAAWQAETPPPRLPLGACVALALVPPREALHARCDARFDAMLEAGALDEVRAAMAAGLPRSAPGLRAVGAPELIAHLEGRLTLEEAAEAARSATRRYAKRQLTWVRNQMTAWRKIEALAEHRTIARLVSELA